MKRSAPLKRKTRLRPMSAKRQREAREYAKKRKVFLTNTPFCEAWATIIRLGDNIGPDWPMSKPYSSDIHHTKGRIGKNYLDESTWLAVCRWSHDWIHANPKEARQLGLLA